MTIDSFSTATSTPQSGAHSDLSTSFSLGKSGDAETAETVRLHLPAGFFINPTAIPWCAPEAFDSFECPDITQVGLITIRSDYEGDPSALLGTAPVYALVPEAGETSRFGFVIPTIDVPLEMPVTLRTGTDYGPDLTIHDLPQIAPLAGAKLTLWSVPAAASHDTERFAPGSASEPAGCPGVEDTSCIASPHSSGLALQAMLQNPTACGVPLTSQLYVSTHQHPSDIVSSAANMPPTFGCSLNAFEPRLFLNLTTFETHTSSGLDLTLKTLQPASPGGLAAAQIKSSAVVLPPGLTIDSAAAGNLGICTESQFSELNPAQPEACPANSKIGMFLLKIAGFEAPLEGTTFFGVPEPGGAYRLFLTASGSGVNAKFIALLQADPKSKQVTVTLPTLPQLPLEEIQLNLASGASLLVTPARCGTYLAEATVRTWGSAADESLALTRSFELTSVGPDEGPCPGPADKVDASLSPLAVPADGISTSTATAEVTDASGIAVPGDEIVFSSTDPAEQIGAVTDNNDGTYTAEITSSTAVGAKTITVTDTSVEPPVFGTATLTQLGPIELRAPPVIAPQTPLAHRHSPRPVTTITGKPPRRGRNRTPTFRFASSKQGSTFSCKVDDRPFRRCSSPTTLPQLGFGPHTFSVRATDATGKRSRPATCEFSIRSSGSGGQS